jgi:hypothetical protein
MAKMFEISGFVVNRHGPSHTLDEIVVLIFMSA